ncbi:S1 family peptidase [Micromonospora eburnea]|uniref:Alpha-lytic protease prodomain-containing protein n=1 Tax=Micromonospora eburnea TaxID=227316 RepID=A0A1C6UG84_9ACTN|nr:S1 family peptidase [Micromonospora eburnea]SCL52968.1 Alpha-lytic protease prodomain-containing protein [Micromonospora eburnea]
MRLLPLAALVLTAVLTGTPAAAHARPDPERASVALAEVRTPGTAWGFDPASGRMTLTVDDTVAGTELAALRDTAARAGAVLRREPGRLRTLIAGGEAIYGGGGRCSLGANVRSGSTYYFVTSGHCTSAVGTWFADSAHTTVLGTVVAGSFPGNDYGVVRYTGTIAHPSAIHTHPGLLAVTGAGTANVGQTVCRSGAASGVRCGIVTGLNQTVNYIEGLVYGLIRTNICAEPGDSGGPLYVASTGTVIGILSGGTGNCMVGGTTYYQPITKILDTYGLTIP